MKIAMIGGNGFLGSNLTPLLVASGHDVLILGRSHKPVELPGNVMYHQTLCNSVDELRTILYDAHIIIDFSYTTTPKTSFDDPMTDLTSNLPRAVMLFEVCKELPKLEKLIVISSGGTVYGKSRSFPIKESAQTKPVSPYGITKLTIEKYAHLYQELYNLPIIIVRPANAYGPKKQISSVQGFISVCLQNVLAHTTTTIFGKSGTVRDYVYIDDIAQALHSVIEFGIVGRTYNLGTGKGTSNIEVIKFIEAIIKRDKYTIKYSVQPLRPFDVPVNILDSSLLTHDTGWKTTVSLEKGIEKTWRYMLEHTIR